MKKWLYPFIASFIISFVFLNELPGHAQLSKTSVTLELVLDVPFTGELISASENDMIAWTVNERGLRSIWIARAPDFKPVRLVQFDRDDGRTLHHLTFTHKGDKLFFVRGDGPNRQGEFPNPDSNPQGAKQVIWMVDLQTGESRELVEGNNPLPRPDGQGFVYLKARKIYYYALEPSDDAEDRTNTAAPNRPLLNLRGTLGQMKWSPDGQSLAFVSQRGDHSFVGVYQFRSKTVTWVSPSVYRDTNPIWSPDGQKIAFIRFPGLKKHERFDLTSGVPFEIVVYHLNTDTAKTVWKSPGNDGGFAQYYPAEPLIWEDKETLVFTSEHEGWLHLYRLNIKDGQAIDITPGEGFVEFFDYHPDLNAWVISSNHNVRSTRRLRMPTGIRTPMSPAITPKNLFATDPVFLSSGKWIAFRGSTAREPSGIYILNQSTKAWHRIYPEQWPANFPASELVTPRVVTFKSLDGWNIEGQLFRPEGKGPFPAIIFMHGGPIRQMLPAWHYREYYARAYAFNQYLTSLGFVVLSVNFRSGIGYGRAFRQAPNQGPRGASEYQDIVAAGLYLRRRGDIDGNRIGLWGGSYGGYLTAMGLARDSDLFRAGVDLHGVHDWSFRATDFIPGGAWGLDTPEELKKAYESSPVADLSLWTSPVLLVHGDDDRNVLFSQTVDLYFRLKELGVPVEVLVLPDEVHGFLRHESWLKVYRAASQFFLKTIKALSD